MKENISLMSLKQIALLLKIWDSPNHMTIAIGKAEGAVVKNLFRKGYIRPTGRIGRTIRWAINENQFTENDFALMRELIK
jgi:hypothetical protein